MFEASGPQLIVIDADKPRAPGGDPHRRTRQGFVAIEQGPPVGTRIALGGGAFLLDGDRVDPIAADPAAVASAPLPGASRAVASAASGSRP